MPRFDYHAPTLNHLLDNQIMEKRDLRFQEQDVAEQFATTQYLTDFIPRSVVRGVSGMHLVLESPGPRAADYEPHPNEVFYINSIPAEG